MSDFTLKNIKSPDLSVWMLDDERITREITGHVLESFLPKEVEIKKASSPDDFSRQLGEKISKEGLRKYNLILSDGNMQPANEAKNYKPSWRGTLAVLRDNFKSLSANSGKFLTAIVSADLEKFDPLHPDYGLKTATDLCSEPEWSSKELNLPGETLDSDRENLINDYIKIAKPVNKKDLVKLFEVFDNLISAGK